MTTPSPSHLYGLVDMGSNGIRFSITDLSPATARSLPTVFQDRLGVSLYDAQWSTGSRGPIQQPVIDEVVAALKRFKAVCTDFEVPETNIKILATEATRTAPNSEDYRKQIKDAIGWEVTLLPKEAEGRIGALGVASSFESVDGLVMDLGGGSTQITWMISENGTVTTSPAGSVSFPYGAAALSQQLSTTSKSEQADLRNTMVSQYKAALETLELPESLRKKAASHGLNLYLSGGGFRGWGYLLMSASKNHPYPIPIINGFHASVKDFADTDEIKSLAEDNTDIFRVSKRRASQVPAVAFLVKVVIEALPFISDIHFCQGGVREGFLFDTLPTETKASSPLTSATSKYVTCTDTTTHITKLLFNSLPSSTNDLGRTTPTSLTPTTICAIANTMYQQSNTIKESASTAAMFLPITGPLSSAHGVSHVNRAILALVLCQRWDGDLPPPHDKLQDRLRGLLTQQEVWWCNYLGSIAALIGVVYPTGFIRNFDDSKSRIISIDSKWSEGLGKKGNMQGVVVTLRLRDDVVTRNILGVASSSGGGVLKDAIERIEDLGKKKNRIGGKEYGFGLPVSVEVEWVA